MRFLAALTLVAGLAICSVASAKPALPRLELQPCEEPGLPVGARCGLFHVEENPAHPNGRALALKVVVTPARSPHPLEPVFYLPGGPGGGAVESASFLAASWITEAHPLVLMDPPGSDDTTGLACPAGAGEDLERDMAPLFSEGEAYWRACRDALTPRADLRAYTTPNEIADYEALRRALGYDRIDLFGASFGTRVGIAYIHAHPDRIRAALLTGVSPLANRSPLFHAEAAQRALDRLIADCKAEPACAAAFPDIRGDLDQVLTRLRTAPARVTIKHPATGQPVEVSLTADAFADSVRVMMYRVPQGRRLPLLLHRAAAGDLQPFAQSAVQNGRAFRHGLRLGLTLSTSCPEDGARIRPREIALATAGSFIGDTRVRGQLAACALWPKTTLPASYYAPFVSQVPTVLVSGELDPVTPPRWGEEARRALPNSIHLVTNDAHADVNPCVAGIAAQVFRTGAVTGVDRRCMAGGRLPAFDTGAARAP